MGSYREHAQHKHWHKCTILTIITEEISQMFSGLKFNWMEFNFGKPKWKWVSESIIYHGKRKCISVILLTYSSSKQYNRILGMLALEVLWVDKPFVIPIIWHYHIQNTHSRTFGITELCKYALTTAAEAKGHTLPTSGNLCVPAYLLKFILPIAFLQRQANVLY